MLLVEQESKNVMITTILANTKCRDLINQLISVKVAYWTGDVICIRFNDFINGL